jgi:phage baseplate assembly protein V
MSSDRILAPLLRRLDMMISRGVLRATSDGEGVQTMQVGLLEDEVADSVERFQTYGLSSVPPNGGDALVCFVQGNRDHGVVVSVNDRGSRPRGLNAGEVILYNDHNVSLRLTNEGKLLIEAEDEITVKAKKLTITITIEDEISIEAPTIKIKGDIELDGNLTATGVVSWGTQGGGGPP